MRNFAPIALFVYNRPEHTARTLEALRKNIFAAESELFIFCDGAKNEDGLAQVRAVYDVVEKISGFKNVVIKKSEKNKGLAGSIISGVSEIVEKFGKVIVLEDDLVTSPYFLQFMNDGLDFYENETRVISIHGYIYPIKKELPKTFFLKGADCWGWATWKRGWDIFNKDGKALLQEIYQRNLAHEFDFDGAYKYTQMLQDQIDGKNNSWAVRWLASAFLADKLTLYPSKSLVTNIGFDNSGTHCDATAQFDQNVFQERILIEQIAVAENKFARKDVKDFFTKKKKRKFFKQLIARQAFDPSLLGVAINPFYFARKGLAKNIRDFARKITGDVLDVECGDKPYENFFNFNRYIGLEYGLPTNQGHKKADFLYDRKKIPFADAQFDSLICRGVLEYVGGGAKDFLQEAWRVMKVGACGIVIAPFSGADGAANYRRYTAFELQEILAESGFEVLEFRKSGDNISTKFQLINFYIYKKIVKNGSANFIEKSLLTLLTFFFNFAGLALCLALPKDDNIYLDNIVLIRKK